MQNKNNYKNNNTNFTGSICGAYAASQIVLYNLLRVFVAHIVRHK